MFLYYLKTPIIDSVEMIFAKTYTTFLTYPFTFTTLLLFWLCSLAYQLIIRCIKNISYDQIFLTQDIGDLAQLSKHSSWPEWHSFVRRLHFGNELEHAG